MLVLINDHGRSDTSSDPPSDPRLPPRSGFATNSDGRGTSPYRTAGRATATAGGGVKRSSLSRVFVSEGGGALSRDNRRSKAGTRSATPGERGELCPAEEREAGASSEGGGDDDVFGWVDSRGAARGGPEGRLYNW